MMTLNSALKSSESQLSNAGSTVKIGHFLDYIMSSEIKVSNPEISEILENVNFLHQQNSFFEGKSTNIDLIIYKNGSENQALQVSITQSQITCGLLVFSNLILSASQHFLSLPFQFPANCRSKREKP